MNSIIKKYTYIENAKKKHGNKYDYKKTIFIHSKKKVIITCLKHGDFEIRASNHLQGSGCRQCYFSSKNKLEELKNFIEKANIVHNNKYDYSKVDYKNSKTKVKIICKKNHPIFEQTPSSHILGVKCPQCSVERVSKLNRLTKEQFIEKAINKHGNLYDYSKTNYIDMRSDITIICIKHGKFIKKARNFIEGRGCPKCKYCPNCLLFFTKGVLCQYCKPKKENKLYQKTKEFKAVEYLRENIDKDFIHNESIGSDCTKNDRKNTNGHIYPDIRFDCIWFQLIVEIDEHQHRGAGYKCDKRIMYDIIAKLGMPCIFIRYNPDNKDSNLKTLEDKINKYLKYEDKINSKELKFDKYGYKCEYLFYN